MRFYQRKDDEEAQYKQGVEARKYVMEGEQILYLPTKTRGELYDQNVGRLMATAERLDSKKVRVFQTSSPFQHVVLCGKALERALVLVSTVETVRVIHRRRRRDEPAPGRVPR